MLKSLTIALVTAASVHSAAVPAFQPHEILMRAVPEFPAAFGYHLLPRQIENCTASTTGASVSASGSAMSAVPSPTSPPGALDSSLASSQVQPGCEEQCKPWMQVVRDRGWCQGQASRAVSQTSCATDKMEVGSQILCEVSNQPKLAKGLNTADTDAQNLDKASTCGFCNAGPERKNEMAKGMKALYQVCEKQYRVPGNVQGVNGANARAVSAVVVAGGLAAALLV